MSSFAERIAGLSPKKQELLARLLQKEQLDASRVVIGPRKHGSNTAPMSFAQERLWVLDQLEPNQPIYNVPDTHHFKGHFQLEALEQSLNELVRRHESLRTTFELIDGEPMQVIGEPQALTLNVIDLSHLPWEEREARAHRMTNEEAQKPFDLSRGPLFRAQLVRLADDEHLLLVTIHHIISDGWSLGVMGRELSALYDAYRNGESSPLPELAIQYADFALWQREWLQGEVLDKQLEYWREQLGGELPELELPVDRPRPARQSYRGAVQGVEFGPEVIEPLKEIARERGGTLFMALLAAFNVLLWRYSRQADLLVGTPIANRNRAETESLIGFFVNTLVLRTKIDGDRSFRELLDQVRETTLGAYDHQDVPFEKLVQEFEPERNLSRQPLFQVMFALNDLKTLELTDLELNWRQTEISTVKFDMTLTMVMGNDYVSGALIYNTDLFDAETIRRMIAQFELLVESVVADPDQRLAELPPLTEDEQEMLAAWNETKLAFPQECLHRLFEAQVARTPEAEALTFNEETLTYAELNRRANQLAHHLRSQGVGPEVLVGILLERSVELVVGILGVLKAGGAFVPIDPSYPQERIDYMLADSNVSVVVSNVVGAALRGRPLRPDDERLGRPGRAAPTNDSAPPVVFLDADSEEIETRPDENPAIEIAPDNLAYAIYTSGSTGRPKGVLIQHQGVVNLAFAQAEAFAVSAASRVLQFASISFDAAISEIFKTLLTGATLCLAKPESLLPVDPLLHLLRTRQITTVTLPPSVWALLPSDALPSLQTAITAGEACSSQIAASWSRDGRRFINAYGPTEVTVCATISRPLHSAERPPIGPPIANSQVHVLDANLRPVPVGVAGELYVGSVGLARGYLHRPELTAERFIPNPFSNEPGSRLYRTGDLGRYRRDGNLEYIGRVDQQVKVRGFRIELGEIESTLQQHPAVRDAVVLAREDTPGDKRLVAYLISEPGATADVSQWRAWLLQKLPDYMVPATFVVLDEFPLTPSGKVDRRALAAPDASRPEQGQAYVAPGDRLEQLLVDLWQATLSLDRIGVKDNFFDVGGNSLKGAILINRLQDLLGEYVYVVAIFDAPTIAELANYLRRHYAEAVTRLCGSESAAADTNRKRITAARISEFKQVIPSLVETHEHAADKTKNPSAIFVLSPPRSGSTLLRVMLAGHPQLFAPPELELLSFNTLAERREAFADRFSFWREGTIRALMELKHCDADTATRLMEECETRQLTTKYFYGLMQAWAGGRVLVDKTPSYALDIEILRRAESDFSETRYIHLIRHPYGMIRSFINARLDQVFFRHQHNLERRELAELIWLLSQSNILEFLQSVPAERQLAVRFEELVGNPERVLRAICEFLGLEYVSEMAKPYQDSSQRMTDGIHPLSKMLGDVKFHEHKSVDVGVAERWRQEIEAGDLLADETWAIAKTLSYQPIEVARPELRPIRRVESRREQDIPLSFAQQRLWVIDQLEPNSAAYNVPLAQQVTGALNVAALEQSFNELVRRHESLRTTFRIAAGQPVQIIGEPQPLRLEVVDLTHLPEAEREREAEREIRAEALQPFDLVQGPLLRVRVVKLEETEHLLLLTMHHIISDGWSMEVLVRELTTLYDAFLEDRPSPLPELPLQYVDFALWQREWLQGEVLEQQLAYWKQQLHGAPPVLALPLDRPRPPVRSTRSAHEAVLFSDEIRAALRQLNQQESATMFMTLLAAFKVLLTRLSGQNDIVVGTPIAGRNRAELENLIGFFVNALVLRTDLSGDPTFRELVQRVRAVSLGAYKYQDFPFEKLVDELKPERDASLTPLFQVMFMYESRSGEEIKLKGLQFTSARAENESGKFDLSLGIVEGAEGLGAVLRYNTDLFNRSTIKRFIACFENLLEGIADNPGRRISEFALLNADERSQVLEAWNQTAVSFPDRCAHQLFEEQVERRPEATALVFADRRLSYREVNRRANQVARYLRARGVGPETLVGICVERSVEMVVALLGVLKAGGAFVPIDPNYPQERIDYMLADAGISVVLTKHDSVVGAARRGRPASESGLVGSDGRPQRAAPTTDSTTLIYLDSDWHHIEEMPTENLETDVALDNLAYAIYTSGSTGRPKGVLLHHRGLTNLALAQAELFGVSEDSRVLQFASFSFDAAVSEIFKTFLTGATLVLADTDSLLPVTPLLNTLREQRITIVTLPPSILAVLPGDDLPELHSVISAGEACSAELAAAWSRSERRFLNAYGPTEITVCATCSESLDGSDKPPIGRPIANAESYVLDANLQPVPIGVVGELYIGGAGVARGYLGRPELTAERFIPHPFATEFHAKAQRRKEDGSGFLNERSSGKRLYRTGDLACFREDGQLDYRGRIDQQVKVRGFRIELEEIESVLAQHPDVRDAVVLAREDVPGDRRLVAYVVTEKAHDAGEWRAWLSQSLPDYMLPAAFLSMESFPLTNSGKIDRAALPAPDANRPAQDQAYVAPRDQLEQLLVDLWLPVLGLNLLGVNDNFFEAGGDSIKGAILINRLQELLGEYVYVVAIFDAPTVAQLATYLRQHYSAAVKKVCGVDIVASEEGGTAHINRDRLDEFRQLITPLPKLPAHWRGKAKNPPALFVLSPPRSGSTLLRVMLAGHPQLFAPPELELLSFNTLAERREAFADRFSFWREGTIRALMELKHCDADSATHLMEEYEAQQLTTKQFYGLMQAWAGRRVLVDKTPSYALDIEILRRAESDFSETRYIHLVRHPYGMIRSFINARLEQVFFRHQHNLERRELAELIWLLSQSNILEFLESVPPERRLQVRFEELVSEPERVLRGICEFLGLEYVSEMATPYQNSSRRMTDGIHPLSKMLGDVKFHEHKSVDVGVAERWRQEVEAADVLGDETWTVAGSLGYHRIELSGTTPATATRPDLRPIRRVEQGREQGLPLSFAQQRLWVLDQLEPGSSAYNIPVAEQISGPLNVAALEQSFNELVRRHESLRTTFTIVEGQPVQIINEPPPLRLEVLDLSHLPAAERESEAERQTHEEAQQPFDLEHGPLLRVRLLKLDETEHVLLLTIHHIVSDGWSMEIIVRELTELYDAFVEDRPSPLPELPLQYVDFALWQREWLRGEVLEQQLAYWKQQLNGAPQVLSLPLDRPRPPARSHRSSDEIVVIPDEVVAALEQLSQHERATMFMTLLAAFKVLLARLSGQNDIVVGTPIAGRSRTELENLIGFFVNMLVLRTDLSGDPTFRELVQRVRAVSLGAYKQQDFPFDKLVDELKVARDASLTPLFQVMFLYETMTDAGIKLTGLQFTTARAENEESGKFDLTLVMMKGNEGLAGGLKYNPDLFDSSTIKRFAACFENLLKGIAANPDSRISQFALLNAAERSQLLEDWNQTEVAFPARCTHQLFEDQVERTADATALVFEDQRLSYGELNRRANQLAHYLRRLGVGPEGLVGICVERSIEMVVGMLGVLKAGGAFVPIDPRNPQERIDYILADAGISILLTQQELFVGAARRGRPASESGLVGSAGRPQRAAPTNDSTTLIYLDSDWRHIEEMPDENLETNVTLDNLAYAIYTSGSTGRPKGVLIPHRGLTNFTLAEPQLFDLSADSRVLQFTSFTFDVSILEIFKSFLNGATLVMARAESLLPVTPLLNILREQRITLLSGPPSVLAILPSDDLPDLRTVISAGEACSAELAAAWSRNGRRFVNGYGPTEITVIATYAGPLDGSTRPPIGRPVANAQCYVLDADLQPVPIGVIGELYVGGAGVARGYLNRPELTAERFIPNPFASEFHAKAQRRTPSRKEEDPGAFASSFAPLRETRLYRTGDLASFRDDGQIDYHGRIDHQVKVRGFRIELEEIESVLGQHPDVLSAIVLAREDVPGDKRLVAYVVTRPGTLHDVGEWRAWLSKSLPDYMLPAAFVSLDAFPLNRSGKIDRAALPAPDAARPSQEHEYVGPRDQLEQLLIDLWQPALRLDQLGVHDNFFEVGGDSIRGAVLINSLQKLLGEPVHVVAIFDAPTVAQMAEYLCRHYPSAVNRISGLDLADVAQETGYQWSPLVELQRGDRQRPIFFVHPVGGNIFCYAELVRELVSEQPFYGLQSFGLADGDAPLNEVPEMAARYLKEVRRVQPEGPYLLGGWSFGGLVAYEMAQQLQRAGQEVELLALLDTHTASAWGLELSEENLSLQFESDMRALHGTAGVGLDSDQLGRLFQVFRGNAHATVSYQPQRYPGRITFFRPSDRLSETAYDPIEEWRNLAGDGVEVHVVPGNHYTILKEPAVLVLADWLKVCLNLGLKKAQTV
jgi:amino acid adenylation domain-containing protein